MKARAGIALLLLLLAPAAPALAADEGGGLTEFFLTALNLLILIGVLVFFARRPIRSFFADRYAHIRDDLQAATRSLEEAEARHEEWSRRLEGLDQELESIRATARERAEAERQRVIAEAGVAAERIRRDARAAVEQELRRAREQLRQEAAELAIQLAGEALSDKVSQQDRDRLIDEFIETIERGEDAGERAS